MKKLFTPPDRFNLSELKTRRNLLISKIRAQSGSGLVIIANNNASINIGVSRFRPDSYFYYLSGFCEEGSILVISVLEKSAKSIIFVPEKDALKETWDGFRLGVSAAPKTLDINKAFAIKDFYSEFVKLLCFHQNVYYAFAKNPQLDSQIISAINGQRAGQRHGVLPIRAVYDTRVLIDEMRLIKSPFEIEQMKYVCQASAIAHTQAMSAVRVGAFENEIMGVLYSNYFKYGLFAPSFIPIVGSGKNSCTLHYQANNQKIPANSVTLIDAGGDYYGYNADITRTVPSGKKFTPAQREVYKIVLKAQKAGINAVKKNRSIGEYHQAVIKVIAEGLRELKILKGSVDKIIEKGDYKRFYMHQAGHFLGMETHDVGIYRSGATWKKFAEGMIVTVEPGIYINASDDLSCEFHNIGIRLEDDILVTAKGNINLTESVPINIDEVEALKS